MAAEASLFPWFAVRVRSNYEKTTSTLLRQKGYEEFLPTFESKHRWSDRTKIVERPLFPGYVFCRFNEHDWMPILRTSGVVCVVGNGKIPEPIPQEEIEAVRLLLRSGLPVCPWAFLRVGQRVRVEQGPVAGTEGILTAVKNRYRVVVSITLLQRSVAVEVESGWLRPL